MYGPSARVILHPKYGVVVALRLEEDLQLKQLFLNMISEKNRFYDPQRGVWYVVGSLWMELGEVFFANGTDATWPDPFLVPEFPDARPPSVFTRGNNQDPFAPPIEEPFDAKRVPGETPRPYTEYTLMGLLPDADMDVVKASYRVLCMKWHPDRGGSHEKMTALNEAFSRIMAARKKEEK